MLMKKRREFKMALNQELNMLIYIKMCCRRYQKN